MVNISEKQMAEYKLLQLLNRKDVKKTLTKVEQKKMLKGNLENLKKNITYIEGRISGSVTKKTFTNPKVLAKAKEVRDTKKAIVKRDQAVKHKLREIFKADNEGKILQIVDNQGNISYRSIRKENLKHIADMLENGVTERETFIRGNNFSDPDVYEAMFFNKYDPEGLTVLEKSEGQMRQRKNGKFFKYYCKMNFDLSRYGILKGFDKEYYKNNCFYHALKAQNLGDVKLEGLKHYMKDAHLSICKITEVCEKLKIKIILHQKRNDNDKTMKTIYGKEFSEEYQIGIIDEHYFVMEDTQLTSFAIDNYETICELKDWNKIEKVNKEGQYKKSNNRFINSMQLFVKLLQRKDSLLNVIQIDNDIMSTPYYNKVEQTIESLEYSDIDYEEYQAKNGKEPADTYTVFFDFESVTTVTPHRGYMVHYIAEDWEESRSVVDYSDNLGYNFLKAVTKATPKGKKLVLIAHNMRYDLSFISKSMYSLKCIKGGNSIICATGKFFEHEVTVKDSYCMISMKLAEFNKSFKLGDTKKEIISYDLYNECIPSMSFTDDSSHYLNIEETLSKYYQESENEFLDNIDAWNLRKGNTFNAVEYASRYCAQDVKVLKAGYLTFRKWMLELYNIDIKNKMTISGLADTIFKENGCYDGCYSFAGVVRKFISQAVIGGRTMISNNQKKVRGNLDSIDFTAKDEEGEFNKLTETKISDFDGVSLYPSAMSRIPGFIKGLPHVFDNTMTYAQLQSKSYYFAEIKITKIGIRRAFPLASKISKQGVRMFNNDMKGETIVVDKITLEDLIEFQKVEFDVIRGYSFEDGFNPTITHIIRKMFNARLEMKKQKNPIQLVYKLIMNSAYGRTILKEQETREVYKNTKEEAMKYMTMNYNNVVECRQLENDTKYVIKMREEVQSHNNYCHIGAMVLSMSKRIMNEVMCTAEDIGIEIFYQDTDSMHLYDKDIAALSEAFGKKYGRELIGEALGQFHTDFSMNGAVGEISSKLCIMLGKKCYVDLLKSEGSDHFECHTRLKGIPSSSILYTARKKYGHKTDTMNVIHLYRDLYYGERVNFDLTCEGKRAKFKVHDLVVSTLPKFKREIKFQ